MSKFQMKFLMLFTVSVTVALALAGDISICQCVESENATKKVAIRFLEKVADISLGAYSVTGYRSVTPGPYVQEKLHSGHVEKWVDMNLSSQNGELKVDMWFMDGKLYHFGLVEGTPITNAERGISLLDCASAFLERYRIQFNVTYCAQLAPMLEQITSLDQEQTIERDESVLKFRPKNETITFLWLAKINGLTMPKGFYIEMDKNGFLTSLSDWCHILHVGNTEVNISREQAVNMALNFAQNHADEIGAKIGKYETALTLYGGRRDCFTLYPEWLVIIHYDKPCGNFDGYAVSIWADTGEVHHSGPQGFYGSETTMQPNPWAIILLVITLMAVPTVLILYQKRKCPKYRSEKAGTTF